MLVILRAPHQAGVMLRWLKYTPKKSADPTLPDPNQFTSVESQQACESANKHVEMCSPSPSRKRKRQENAHYTPEQRAKVAKYAIDNGVMNAARKFEVSESTVRNFKRKLVAMAPEEMAEVKTLEIRQRGRPLLLGQYDKEVCAYVQAIRKSGGIINNNIVRAGARGIIMAHNKALLPEYGGHIVLDKPWGVSLLKRLGYTKRKGTRAARKNPENFEEISTEYKQRIGKLITDNNIPAELVINWDQTGIKLVPVSNWTMEKTGNKQITISGLGDKREMTGLLSITLSGELLPPQVLYGGLTDGCHPKFNFPEEWDIFHTENHWSNSSSMLRFVDKIIIPYVESIREKLPLARANQYALCIFDVFAAHRNPELIEKLKENHIHMVYVPASCTDQLQPLDLKVNKYFKDQLRTEFNKWYSQKVADALANQTAIDDIKIDLRASALKPLHANWLVAAVERLKKQSELIKSAFAEAGIVQK